MPQEGSNPVTFFKDHLLWQALEPTARQGRGSPYRLKAFLAQERLALQSYHLNSWIEYTYAGLLTHTYTKERGCSALHHILGFQWSPGQGQEAQQTFRSDSCPRLTTRSIHSNANNSDFPPSASWIGFVIEILATCMTGMVGWMRCVIELIKQLHQMVNLLVQTWLSWSHVDQATRIVGRSVFRCEGWFFIFLSCIWDHVCPSSPPSSSYSFCCSLPPHLTCVTWFLEFQALAYILDR